MSSKARTVIDRSTTRKVVGSLALVGTAAAVAGMGTFGNFTASTTPVTTTVSSGTMSINVAQPNGAFSIPVTTTGFVPGDSMTRAINLVNDGGSALSAVTVSSLPTVSSILNTDSTNGLQLAIKACSVPYTQGGTASAATYTCSGTERTLVSGPVTQTNVALTNPAALNAGGTDYLTLAISLPASADNTFQGKTSTLSITFTGVQRAAGAR